MVDAAMPAVKPSKAPAAVLTILDGTGRNTSSARRHTIMAAVTTGGVPACNRLATHAFIPSSNRKNGTRMIASNNAARRIHGRQRSIGLM